MKDSNSSSSSSTRMEPIGQSIIKLISNLCFSLFVFFVLIITVIAITYKPPDPWLESSPALTNLFTQSQNATFRIDSSILKTGEELCPSPQDSPLPLPPATVALNETIIDRSEQAITNFSTREMECSCCMEGCCTLSRDTYNSWSFLVCLERWEVEEK